VTLNKKKVPIARILAVLAIIVPFAKSNEGLSVVPYKDVGGVWTWCYGETQGPIPKETLTGEQCSVKLWMRLHVTAIAVWYLVDVPMSDSRWASLISFSDNLGLSSLRKSTLLKKINQNDPKACDQFMRWTMVGKIDCKIPENRCMGIPNRRKEEMKLCNS